MYKRETVLLLGKIFDWSIVDVMNIDEDKYLLSKKFSEVKISDTI